MCTTGLPSFIFVFVFIYALEEVTIEIVNYQNKKRLQQKNM